MVVAEGGVAALNGVPLTIPEYVTPLIIKLKGPVPEVALKVNCPVPPEQIVLPDKLPCGKGMMVIVADEPIKPLLRMQPLLPVTDTSE